jgi:alkylhydroperoxidase/carboxymuconolactone decarboxylase family protein YurZ
MAEKTMMEILQQEAPAVAASCVALVGAIMAEPALPEKTKQLIYIAVCAAVHHERGVTIHAGRARALGATRAEVREAILLTIPAAGLSGASRSLAPALAVFDG